MADFLTQDDPSVGDATSASPQWGIFDSGGNSVIDADSVVAFDFKQEFDVSDFPQEKGAFQSYDKVQHPFDVRVRVTRGGSDEDRAALQQSVDAIIPTTDVYDVVTSDKTFEKVNIHHQDLRRTNEQGPGRIEIEVWGTEIRDTADAQFSNTSPSSGQPGTTQSPSGAAQQNGGIVQTEDVRVTAQGHISDQLNSGGGGW